MKLRKAVFYTKKDGSGAFSFTERHLSLLKSASVDTDFVFTGWDDSILMREAENCDLVVVQNNHPLPNEFFMKAQELKWVHCLMSGTDQICLYGHKDITLTATKGIQEIPISEYVLAMILTISRKLYISRDNQQQRRWVRPDGITELRGTTAGIVGLGLIGSEIARLLRTVGINVVSSSNTYPNNERLKNIVKYYPKEQFFDFLGVCDYIILSVPLTKDTKNLFGNREFELMKSNAWIINIARGAVINENELYKALIGCKIAGACLDVATEEPRPESDPLWSLSNVIITPHNANETSLKMDRIVELLCKNIQRYTKNEPLLFVERK